MRLSKRSIVVVSLCSILPISTAYVSSTFRVPQQYETNGLGARQAVVLKSSSNGSMDNPQRQLSKGTNEGLSNLVAASIAVAIGSFAIVGQPLPSSAYDASDYASEAVQAVIQQLKDSGGNVDATFKAYENLAEIITEGKGVGGMINYQGVELERGYIADEDTTIYNPGLSLLTESEKERLVEAVINSRKEGLANGQWNDDNELGFSFLREKLDPYHMKELSGYLSIVPFYGAILYLVVLAIQQLARDLFPVAYLVGVVAFFGPIVALVLVGPQ